MNHWISNIASLPSSSSYTFSCFNFCPLGQEARCSTPMGQRPSCPPVTTPVTPSPSPPAASPSPPASPPSSSPAPQLPPCPAGQFRWPKDKGDYCWWRRDSGGARQGPGDNIFKWQNAVIDERTDALVLTIARDASGVLSCGEVLTNRSLGYGDYVWTVQTDPSTVRFCTDWDSASCGVTMLITSLFPSDSKSRTEHAGAGTCMSLGVVSCCPAPPAAAATDIRFFSRSVVCRSTPTWLVLHSSTLPMMFQAPVVSLMWSMLAGPYQTLTTLSTLYSHTRPTQSTGSTLLGRCTHIGLDGQEVRGQIKCSLKVGL